MSKGTKITIIIVFLITVVLIASAVVVGLRLQSQQESPPEETNTEQTCPAAGECLFVDCSTQRLFGENCESEIVDGFCCSEYDSPTDICQKKDFCAGALENNLCEDAGTEFNTCDRCSTGKSSNVIVKQGEVACEYEFEICKPDSECGEIPENESEILEQENALSCADERETGEEWKECCIGDNEGKSRIVKKDDECSFSIVQDCTTDKECAVEVKEPSENNEITEPEATQEESQPTGAKNEAENAPTPTEKPEAQVTTESTENEDPTPTEAKTESDPTATPTKEPNEVEATEVTTIPEEQNNPVESESKATATLTTEANDPAPETQNNEEIPAQEIQAPVEVETPNETPIPTIEEEAEEKEEIIDDPVTTEIVVAEATENTIENTEKGVTTILTPTIKLEELPETSIEFREFSFILLGLTISLFGIVIYRVERIQEGLEKLYIDLRYVVLPKPGKNQEKRSRKLFEKKFKKEKE